MQGALRLNGKRFVLRFSGEAENTVSLMRLSRTLFCIFDVL